MSLAPTKVTPDDFQKPYDAMSYQESALLVERDMGRDVNVCMGQVLFTIRAGTFLHP